MLVSLEEEEKGSVKVGDWWSDARGRGTREIVARESSADHNVGAEKDPCEVKRREGECEVREWRVGWRV